MAPESTGRVVAEADGHVLEAADTDALRFHELAV
jgi:hypothetical protein